MEPVEIPRMNEEAMETTKRIIVHILNPLREGDRREIINHLCDEFDVRQYD